MDNIQSNKACELKHQRYLMIHPLMQTGFKLYEMLRIEIKTYWSIKGFKEAHVIGCLK